MAETIQLRRDTKANWILYNPILADGEVGLETDTRRQKFGDGVTHWNDLLYSEDGFPHEWVTQEEYDVLVPEEGMTYFIYEEALL